MGVFGEVFVSHTSELAGYPAPRSFVQAACDAVLRAGGRPAEMGYFAAREGKPAEYCRSRVRTCDVFVGVVGFRYGSLVPGHEAGLSYTEVEFEEAGAAGLPRLVFLLDPDARVPRRLADVDGRAVEGFRGRLRAAGVIVGMFTDAGDLGEAVLHALGELRTQRETAGGTGGGRRDAVSPARRPWMVPAQAGPVVDREELASMLLAALTGAGAAPVGLTTALEGAGGFGKTTLAAQVCRTGEVEARFPGGLLWATVGEHRAGADLAGEVGRLCEVVSGERPGTADPMVAGARLGELLDLREPTLLVVDDVWSRDQLEPFLVGGAYCRRLVTTRNAGVVPHSGLSLPVDAMTPAQAAATLTAGITGMPPGMVDRLLASAGRWPVLLGLVNAAVAGHMQTGAPVGQAAGWVARQLEQQGPTALDIADAGSRDQAVAATMAASLDLLDPAEQDRYLDLAIFPERAVVGDGALELLWGATGRLDAAGCRRLRGKLTRLRLASGRWDGGEPALGLHDVLRAYLRRLATSTRCVEVNTALVEAARGLLRGHGGDGCAPWWTLPGDADYLWRHLPYHLAEAGRVAELTQLVCDLRWVAAKTTRFGSSVSAEADLALVGTSADGRLLRAALGSAAHLLTRIDPPAALGATLASRLGGIPGLGRAVEVYRGSLPRPRLENRWPLPDQPGPDARAAPTLGAAGGGGRPDPAEGHTGDVFGCAFSPDGRLLASAGEDGTVRIWEIPAGRLRTTLGGHAGGVRGCAFSPDGRLLAFGSGDRSLQVRDVATGRLAALLEGHTGWVYCCAFSPDGRLLASAGADRTVRVWQVAGGAPSTVLEGHTGGVYGCAFSPDGRLLASAGADRTVRVWQVATARAAAVLEGHTGGVWGCAFSPDGRLLASAGADRTVRVWQVATARAAAVLEGHTAGASDCVFSPDGQLLASTSNDGTVRIWDTASASPAAVLEGHAGWVRCCAVSPDGRLLASAGFDATVRIWDVTSRSAALTLEGSTGGAWGCAFSPDGRLLASTGRDGKVYVRDVATGRASLALDGHPAGANGCAFSPDGRLLASTGEDGAVRIWDAATGRPAAVLAGHAGGTWGCAFSPDGRLLASANAGLNLQVWEVDSHRAAGVMAGHTGGVWGCAFSPDGRLLASASSDGTVRIWNAATGACTAVLTGHGDWVWGCAFSPDSRLVASTSGDGTVRIWNAATGECTAVLTGHGDWVWGCAFSPDGRLLASAGNDWTLRVWDTATGSCTAALRVARPLHDCAWHPHDNTIAAAGGGGSYLFTYRP